MKKSGKHPQQPGHRPVLVFLIKCLIFWGVALFIVSRFSFVEEAGIRLTVATLQRAFALIGQKVERSGSALYTGDASVEIVSDCSPHMPFLIFAAVILAFPSSWKQRALGLLFGAIVIHLFNTIRIMTLIWILSWRRNWFDFAHVYLWQTGTILIVFVTFALWIRTLAHRPKTA
jgi:exosortase/archaeosortase family protein